MKGGELIPTYQKYIKTKKGDEDIILSSKFDYSPHLIKNNSINEDSFEEILSDQSKAKSIPNDLKNLRYELSSSAARIADMESVTTNIEVTIRSSNGTPFNATDLICMPHGLTFFKSFFYENNMNRTTDLDMDLSQAFNMLNLITDYNNQRSSNWIPSDNSSNISAASVDITNDNYNRLYHERNQEGIVFGSESVRKFKFSIPLTDLLYIYHPDTSDLSGSMPNIKHTLEFNLKSDLTDGLIYELNSAAALDNSSITIDNLTLFVRYLNPAYEVQQYINNLRFKTMFNFTHPEYIKKTGLNSSSLNVFIKSYADTVSKVIVMLTPSSVNPPENKFIASSSTLTDAFVEFSNVRIHNKTTADPMQKYYRNYILANKFNSTTSYSNAPLNYRKYFEAYSNSLYVFDLTEYSDQYLLKQFGDNKLYINGNVDNVDPYDLNVLVIRESTGMLEFMDGVPRISNLSA